MNDFKRLTKTFDRLGIAYKAEEGQDVIDKKHYNKTVTIGTEDYNNNFDGIGYSYFEAVFYFLNNKFVCHGEWE